MTAALQNRRAPACCTCCPPGSATAADALRLDLDGPEARELAEQIGVIDGEALCPHCVDCALAILRRYRARRMTE